MDVDEFGTPLKGPQQKAVEKKIALLLQELIYVHDRQEQLLRDERKNRILNILEKTVQCVCVEKVCRKIRLREKVSKESVIEMVQKILEQCQCHKATS